MRVLEKIAEPSTLVMATTSGIALGLNAPGYGTHLIGLVALFPFFLVLDRIHQSPVSLFRKLCHIFLVCWLTGFWGAVLGTHWMIHCIHYFGGVSWLLAFIITGVGYGLIVAIVLFFCFALPVFFIKHRTWWNIPLRLSYFLAVEPFIPHLFPWTFGGLTFSGVPWISQVADLVGEHGLGFFSIGENFLLLLLWRRKTDHAVDVRIVQRLAGGFLLVFGIALAYGAWRSIDLGKHLNQGSLLRVAAIQPNFTPGPMLHNPALSYSTRQRNLPDLIENSRTALQHFPSDALAPKLVVWPESTYPSAYFKHNKDRQLVEQFARDHNTAVLLQSVDWERSNNRYRYYGIAVLVGEDGRVIGRYDKISLMPFGEYLPGEGLFRSLRGWLGSQFHNMSEFEAGKEFTVFSLPGGLCLASSICFDAFSPEVIPQMVRNGAELVINLSNLAWFGKSNASRQIEMALRWKAIENRVPVLYSSNSGETVLINALGEDASERLGLFRVGSFSENLALQRRYSFYREHTRSVQAFFTGLFVFVAILAHLRGRAFSGEDKASG